MTTGLQFFTPFKRNFKGPLDASLVFESHSNMLDYLENDARYAGQVVACKEFEGKLFVLNNTRNEWLEISGSSSDTGNYVSESDPRLQHIEGFALPVIKYGKYYVHDDLDFNKEFIAGMHIPGNDEFNALINHIDAIYNQPPNDVGVGNHLKSTRQVGSPINDVSDHPRWNPNATHYGRDTVNFNALPAGSSDSDWGAWGMGSNCYLWSAEGALFTISSANGNTSLNNWGTEFGCSIRLVREASQQEQNSFSDGDIVEEVFDFNGNKYECVLIGGQVWTRQNLAAENYIDGTSVSAYDYNFDVSHTFTEILYIKSDDPRLTNPRTPTDHNHGIITHDGKAASAKGKALITGEGGLITTGDYQKPISYGFCFPSGGENGDVYLRFDMDEQEVIQVYMKINGVWSNKPRPISLIKYGKLYRWADLNFNKWFIEGMHVPDDSEIFTLRDYLIAQYGAITTNNLGNHLKHPRKNGTPVLGSEYNTSIHPRWDADPTHYGLDSVNFSALPGGSGSNDSFSFFGTRMYFWSTSFRSSQRSSRHRIQCDSGLFLHSDWTNVLATANVRCVREATAEEQALNDGTIICLKEDFDGNWYQLVKIGTQVWTRQSMAATHYTDGTPVNSIDFNNDENNTFFAFKSESIWQ